MQRWIAGGKQIESRRTILPATRQFIVAAPADAEATKSVESTDVAAATAAVAALEVKSEEVKKENAAELPETAAEPVVDTKAEAKQEEATARRCSAFRRRW